MSKISQIKLNETLYNIDVAAELKSSTPTKDSMSVATSGAVYAEQEARKAADNLKLDKKPDGSVELIDPDSGKISYHYLHDSILGQLKFGGLISYSTPWVWIFAGSNLLVETVKTVCDCSNAKTVGGTFANAIGDNLSITDFTVITHDSQTLYVPISVNDLEGFYFLVQTGSSDKNYPYADVGDWLVVSGGKLEKIDNTDAITHIDETDGDSPLEITGTSGLKLNGIFKNKIGGIVFSTDLYTSAGRGITSGGWISGTSIAGESIAATSRMTAPTITDKTNKSQVINLEYFENNATKVDWENIDSDVRIINGHNFKIQGTYTEQNIGCGILPSSFDSIEPQRDSSTGQWEWGVDKSWTSPYWGYFEIKKNCRYIVKPAKTSGPFNNAECLDSGASVLVAAELSTAPLLELTSEDHDLIYQPSVYDEVSWEPSFGGYIEFKSPIDGFAFFGTVDTFDPVLWVVTERVLEKEASAKIEGDLKVTGDIEITGDLSFGADSHLVFGTIEGTDFIADHAKVASDPVEDTDVVNKAYLEAYIASLGGVGGSYPAAEDIAF